MTRRSSPAFAVGGAERTKLEHVEQAIEPIRHWYDSLDHEPRDLVDVITDMVFDIKADRQMLTEERIARTRLADHIAEQSEHCRRRHADGISAGAVIWRIALEDVIRENAAILAKIGKEPVR